MNDRDSYWETRQKPTTFNLGTDQNKATMEISYDEGVEAGN